jgi:hypothetical protein
MHVLTRGIAATLLVTASAASAQNQTLKPDETLKPACLDLTIMLPEGQVVGIHPLQNGQCVMKIQRIGDWCKIIFLNSIANTVEHSKKHGYFITIDPFSSNQARPCE